MSPAEPFGLDADADDMPDRARITPTTTARDAKRRMRQPPLSVQPGGWSPRTMASPITGTTDGHAGRIASPCPHLTRHEERRPGRERAPPRGAKRQERPVLTGTGRSLRRQPSRLGQTVLTRPPLGRADPWYSTRWPALWNGPVAASGDLGADMNSLQAPSVCIAQVVPGFAFAKTVVSRLP